MTASHLRLRLHARVLLALTCLALTACEQSPDEAAPTLLRLNPAAVQAGASAEADALFDRDTTTGLELERPLTLTLAYAQDVQPQRLKVFAQGRVRAELSGAPAFEARGEGAWESLTATGLPAARAGVTLTLTPLDGKARVEEVELWGPGLVRPFTQTQVLAERSRATGNLGLANVLVFSAQPNTATLTPRGAVGGEACATFLLPAPVPLGTVRRAHVVYEAQGVQRPSVLRRSLNGRPAQGGFWLGAGSKQHTLADEVNPSWLARGNSLTLCLPDAATQQVELSGVRVLLEQDDGTQPFERELGLKLGAALDGDARTSAAFAAGALELAFSRPLSVDAAQVDMDVEGMEVQTSLLHGGDWQSLGALSLAKGRNALVLDGRTGSGVRLSFGAGRRPDVPAASVAELLVAGSGVGPRLAAPRLVLTSPGLRALGERFSAEHASGRAYLSGWAESASGRGVVEVDGVSVDNGDGSFGVELNRPTGDGEWSVTVTARFPDGTSVSRVLVFDRDVQAELDDEALGSSGSAASSEALYGAEEQTVWGRVDGEKGGKVRLGERAEFDAPAGAVDGPLSVGITRKMPEALPPLDPGMVNVTAPVNAGYRFSPPGQKFKKAVTIRLPYDPALLPEGIPPEQVQTFYFDKGGKQWMPLTRKQVLRATQQVESETTHFTFMINAVLALPEHPGPVAFDPTSIKDLEVANPAANVDLLAPPEGGALGTASLSMPLRLPGARGSYAPSLQVAYDSSGGNGWLGVGWDVSVSSVQVDTRFGAPFHDGSERFTLDGEQLVPVGSGPCADGSSGKRYGARIERTFRRVVRCGEGSDTDRFEVAQQDGVLFLYGVTEGARLADPADGRRIGQWLLERVVDPHGNLTAYRYTRDARRDGGTAFDQANHEPFTQRYLKEILYSGKVERASAALPELEFLAAAQMGPYLVELELERNGSGLLERPDIQINGRMGFKTVTRYRLGRVKVRLNTASDDTVIREYRFVHEQGDFGKSRLARVELFGVGGVASGALFHSHALEYQSVHDLGASAFPDVVRYPFSVADDEAMTASTEWALGAHAYAGIGFTVDKQQGSVGARVGFNHRESTTQAMLLDLNGDGLPDRVRKTGAGLLVQLNDPQALQMTPVAPAGDPNAGLALRPVAGGLSLGSESGDSVNAALQATFASFSANVGLTRSWSNSSRFTLDADGDGLVDFINDGNILFNQPRGTGVCAASSFCFLPSKQVTGNLDFGNLADAQGVFAGDPALADAAQDLERDFHPTDAMLEWTAPYHGAVDVSGSLKWLAGRTPATAGADGVRLRVYRHSELLAEYTKSASDLSATAVSVANVTVQPFDRLYFVLSTLKKTTIDAAGVPLEEVQFSPVVRYTRCSGGCGGITPADAALEDPTGASLFTFDAQRDFKLAGGPMVAVQIPRAGTLELTGRYASTGAADDVRVCVQHYRAGEQPQVRACRAGDLLLRSYAGGVGDEQLSQSLQVASGEQLVFRLETELPIDPDSVRFEMGGEMTSVCTPGGGCAPPSAEDRARLRFAADAHQPLHPHVEDLALRPLVIPEDGTLYLKSSTGTQDPASDQVFSARMRNRLLFKHRRAESRELSIPVHKGQQLLFQAHSPTFASRVDWNVSAELEVPKSGGGTERRPLAVESHFTNEMLDRGPFLPPAPPRASPFGGGFHGWRYGVWGGRHALAPRPEDGFAGRDEESFDSSLFYSDAELDLGGGSDRDKFRRGKVELRDEESDIARRTRLFAPMVPRRHGTRVTEGFDGLMPGPAFVSPDGTAFATRGTLHGGHRGVVATGPDGTVRTADAAFRIGDTSRASTSTSFAAGIGASLGAGSLSLNVSTGRTSQRMDVRDMNGDGIIDVVVNGQRSGNGVRLTHLHSRGLRRSVSAPGTALSESSDLTASFGMGLSSPIPQVSATGRIKGMEGMYPSGFSVGVGVSATLSATEMDLVDVNGDGLADQVRRDGGSFRVRLNLGNRFAAQEDLVPVAAWQVNGTFDPLVERLGVENPEGADAEEQEGRGSAMSALESLASPDVVRRGASVTLEGNLGLTIAEDYGVTANWASSLNGTQVVLTDVTGDGLPDYVRKGSGESAFRVKVNRGYGFGPEERWPVPGWPTGVTKPRFKVNSALDQTVIPLLGLQDGIDTVEASGSHSRLPSVGFVFTIPVPLPPLGTPVLHFSFGADATPERISGFELGLMDVNGDGLADHVLKTEEVASMGGVGPGPSPGNRSAVYARLNGYAGANLLKRVQRPLGSSFTLAYKREGNTVDMPESRFVLASVEMDDGTAASGPGHRITTRYTYAGGRYDRAEREFLGFASVTRTDADGSLSVQTFANDTVARKGSLLRDEKRDAAGRLYTAILHTYGAPVALSLPQPECTAWTPFFLSAADYCSSSFTPLVRVERRLYEGQTEDLEAAGMRSAQVTRYDATTGNVTDFEDLGDLADPSDDLSAHVDYASSPALTALHHQQLVRRVQVRAGRLDSPGALLREREGFYDDVGNLRRQLAHMGGGRVAETLLEWNAEGQLRSLTGPPNAAGQAYRLDYTYDAVTRGMQEGISDSFGYSSRADYDLRFQQVLRATDVAGNVTERSYDDFGRLVQVWSPYEPRSGPATISMEYRHTETPAAAVTRHLLPADEGGPAGRLLTTSVFVDGFTRALQTKKTTQLEGGIVGESVTGHIGFDVMGRVVQRGHTFFDNSGPGRFAPGAPLNPSIEVYDVLGRVLSTTNPDGSSTSFEYGFGVPAGTSLTQQQATVTDALRNVRALYRDVSDRVSATEERVEGRRPTTRYEQDPLGQVLRVVDAAGNASISGYDLLGQRTHFSTPDTGLTEFRYDLAGNLTERIDPNLSAAGLSIRYEYDFNRLRRVDRPISPDILYAYGPPGAPENGAARVVRIEDEAGVETRGYGPLGELTRTTRTVRPLRPSDRERTFTTAFAFDPFGRMLRVVYPDGEDLRYGYDAGGLLRTAVGYRSETRHAPAERQVYLVSLEYDVFGQRTRQVFGNDTLSTYEYEPLTRRLHAVRTRSSRGRTLQALSYSYDAVGNVRTVVNALGQPVGSNSGAVSFSYLYDELYRLTSASGTALARPGLTDRFHSTFTYDDLHNLRRSTQVRELLSARTRDPNAARPDNSNYDDVYEYLGSGPHQATRIGDTLLTYDLNGNTLVECRTVNGSGCDDTGGTTGSPETHNHYRRFSWTEDNTLRSVVDGGGNNTTRFFYDAAGERVVKLGRGGTSLTLGQFFSIKGKRHGTKHIFAGPTRVASKLMPVPDGDIGFADGPGSSGSGGPELVLASATGPDPDNTNGCVPSENQPNKCPVVVPPIGGDAGEAAVRPATYYYHPDHLGSSAWVTDQLGRVHEHQEYYPFGEVWREGRHDEMGAPVRSPTFLFTGKEFDEETGLGYFGARYYDARKARWVSADPFREEWGSEPAPKVLSLYSYSNHSPATWVDADGRLPNVIVGALIGGAVGAAVYGVQAAVTGNFSARGLAAATAGGAVSGAVAGATMGASLLVQVSVGGGGAAVAGGITRRGIETGSLAKATDPKAMAFDATIGVATAGVGAAVSRGLTASAGRSAAQSARPNVWALNPFERGRQIEAQLGGNLPGNFPVIDRFVNGIARSIKSIDLRAATYQNPGALARLIRGYVDKVAAYRGTGPNGWAGVTINPGQVAARELQIAIPAGATSAQMQVINQAVQQAQARGVRVIVTVIQ